MIGTSVNKTAADWIDFEISDPPNLALVRGIRVSDKDSIEHDLLEEVQLVDSSPTGDKFHYRIKTKRSFKSGMVWFSTTPLGIAIFGGIGLAVFLLVLSNLNI